MSTVRQLAKQIAVICTIHQPSAEIVLMFDWLLLMRPGGEVVYFNPVQHLPRFFKEKGLGECPKDKNIADFALDQIRTLDTAVEKAKGKDEEEKKEEKNGEEGKEDEDGKNEKDQNQSVGKEGQPDEGEAVQRGTEKDNEGPHAQREQQPAEEQRGDEGEQSQPYDGQKRQKEHGQAQGEQGDGRDQQRPGRDKQQKGDGQREEGEDSGDREQQGKKQDMAKTFSSSEEGRKVQSLLKSGVYSKYKGKKPQDIDLGIDDQDGSGDRNSSRGDDEHDQQQHAEHPDKQTSDDPQPQQQRSSASAAAAARNEPQKSPSPRGSPQGGTAGSRSPAQVHGGGGKGDVGDGDDEGGANDQSQHSGEVQHKDSGDRKTSVQAAPLTPIYTQFRALLTRELNGRLRNRREWGIRVFLALFMAMVVGTVFFQLGYDNYEADERISAIFVTLLFLMFTANSFLPELFASRPMYFRETTASMYTALPSFLARTVADLPFMLLEIVILTIPICFIVGLNPQRGHSPLGWLFLGFLGVRWTSITCTYFIGTLVAMPNNANTLQATYFNLQFAFTGFLIPAPYIPSWWKWFYDLCYLRWALAFLAANESNGEEFYCDPDQRVDIPTGYNACSLSGLDPQGVPKNLNGTKCGYTCGQDVLNYYGVEGSVGWMALDISVLWGFAIFFAVAAFFALKLVNHVSR